MTRERAATCTLGLTGKDLSDWRAEGNPPAIAEQIASHVSSCGHCQAILVKFDKIDIKLRTQRVPAPSKDQWQTIRAQISSSRPRTRSHGAMRRIWSAVSVAAALLIIVGGFVQLVSHRTTSRTSQSLKLSWLLGTVPAGVAGQYTLTDWRTLPIAPSDGSTLYGCDISSQQNNASPTASQGAGRPEIWVTHDRALHWQQVGLLPLTRSDVTLCYLTVDTLDPSVLIAVASWSPVAGHPAPDQSATFVSYTGGQTWELLPEPKSEEITRVATHSGITYAYFDGSNPADRHLMTSTDRMRSWREIDQDIVAQGQEVLDFYVDPGVSTIWAEVGRDGKPARQLWMTTDGGRTWSQLPAPTVEQYVVEAGSSPTATVICGTHYDASNTKSASNHVFCSHDAGQHWSSLPSLNMPATVPVGPAHVGENTPIQLLAIASDGSLLALNDGSATPQIYGLSVGSDQWQLIGILPHPQRMVVFYARQSSAGVLWASSAGAQPVEPTNMVFTSNYP